MTRADITEIVILLVALLSSIIIFQILKTIIIRSLSINIGKLNINDKKEKTLKTVLINILKVLILSVDAIIILEYFGINTGSILASLGIAGVIIGLAVQDTIKDFLAGISILFERYFDVGDVIEVDGFKGEVIDFSLKTTKVKRYTGEVKVLANHNITSVINYSLNSSLAIVDVGVSYSSDLKKVDKVLNNLCKKLTKNYELLDGEVAVFGVKKLADSSVVYRVTALAKNNEHYRVQSDLMRDIKLDFDKNNINIPFNVVEVINGKAV